MKFLKIIFILFVVSCSNGSKCVLQDQEMFKNNKVPVLRLKDVDNTGYLIRDRGLDSIKGGEYVFSDHGRLLTYHFFQTSIAYSYSEEYDINGNFSKGEGLPLVDTKIREVNADSALLKLLFFSLNKKYGPLTIRINNSKKIILPLEEDTVYSNMKAVTFGLNISTLSRFKIFLEIDCREICGFREILIRDTLSLIKNPQLNFE